VNLLAAHAIRFKMSWKRSGILLIHAGLIVMMMSELITGLMAVEGNMTIREHGFSNFTEDFHHSELAFVRSDEKTDDVAVVPERFLATGELVQHG
jgi:cytochrome c biogenesis protein ResB